MAVGEIRPSDFDLADVIPTGDGFALDARITLDDVLQMRPDYFEGLVAALWQQRGFPEVQRTPTRGDHGIDVVALHRPQERAN